MDLEHLETRARVARRRALRLGLRFQQDGLVFTVTSADGARLSAGSLDTVDTYLVGRANPKPSGPASTTAAPPAWADLVDEYLLTLSAAGQRPATIRLRKHQLSLTARELNCAPEAVTGRFLLAWFGAKQDWTPAYRKSHRYAVLGFFKWAHLSGHIPTNPAVDLPKVRVPKSPPRPASDSAWESAWTSASPRVRVMLRLAGETGLRRSEVAQVHTDDLLDLDGGPCLIVHGKGGKQRIVPVSGVLAAEIRAGAAGHTAGMPVRGYLFPGQIDGHMSPDAVGRLVAGAMPSGWSMHTLRHRFATRAYRGSRNIRAVQELLGHESVTTTERYTQVDDDELRTAMLAASR